MTVLVFYAAETTYATSGVTGGELAWRLIVLALLLVAAAFLSMAEISLVSVNRFRVRSLKEEGNRRAEKLDRLLEHPNRFLSTILMLTLLVQVGASAIATGLALNIGLPVADTRIRVVEPSSVGAIEHISLLVPVAADDLRHPVLALRPDQLGPRRRARGADRRG